MLKALPASATTPNDNDNDGRDGKGPRPPKHELAANFVEKTANVKLAPVDHIETPTRPRPDPKAPFVSTTSVSIVATCPTSCPLRDAGCYAQTGFLRFASAKLDAAARGLSSTQVIEQEVGLVDGAFKGGTVPQDGYDGGRDLRYHVAGDVRTGRSAPDRSRPRAVAQARRRPRVDLLALDGRGPTRGLGPGVRPGERRNG